MTENGSRRPRRELISPGTRGRFRALMTNSYLREIDAAFQDEGFAPSPDCVYEDSSERRVRTQEYLDAVDWTDLDRVTRALRAFERLLEGFEDESRRSLRLALRRDGYELDEHGQITRIGPQLMAGSLAGLRDPAAIVDNLDRIHRAIADDPAQAVGSAKELIESTAKTVLLERGLPVNERDDLPALVRQAQDALSLHPASAAEGPDGSDAVKKILGAASSLAVGVAELRNRGYGTGHGPAGTRVGLHPRHAQLAVNAAVTWCQLLLDTLADKKAPWRKASSASEPGETGAGTVTVTKRTKQPVI